MSTPKEAPRGSNGLFAGMGLLMVLCCAIGPGIIGAGAGSAVGGWLGIAVACVAAAGAGFALYLRGRKRGGC